MDAASSPTGEIALPEQAEAVAVERLSIGIPAAILESLCVEAGAPAVGLTDEEFGEALAATGAKFNYGLAPGVVANESQRVAFFRGLRLPELALARGCALGRDAAWERFFATYRAPLTQAAIAITGSATQGHDLADALYAQLYGLRERGGERVSPLLSYSGRGSLLGWLRTTLAQRHVDHHRRTHRETPLDELDVPAPVPVVAALETTRLTQATERTMRGLDAEDRFLLSGYYLDRRTLLELSRTLRVHEATVSRRLKRLTSDVRKRLLQNLQAAGLSRRAAEEALGADPRDIEINLRQLLQSSQLPAFQEETSAFVAQSKA